MHDVLLPGAVLTLLSSCAKQAEADALKTQVASVQTSVEKLERDARWQEMRGELESFAYLTPGSDGYSVVRWDLGSCHFLQKCTRLREWNSSHAPHRESTDV